MVELFTGIFKEYTILIIPVLAGVLTSFIAEAWNQMTIPKWQGKFIVIFASLISTVIFIFVFLDVLAGGWDIVLIAVLNYVFAIVFYALKGKAVVEATVGKAVKRLGLSRND